MNNISEFYRNLAPIILIIIIYIIYLKLNYYSKEKISIRKLKKLKPKSLHKVKNNEYVKLVGNAKAVGKTIIAPISGRECICYKVFISFDDDKYANPREELIFSDFFIETNDFSVIIKTKQEDLYDYLIMNLNYDFIISSKDKNPKAESYLAKKRVHGRNEFNLTINEAIIGLDESISVAGIANWKTLNKTVDGFNQKEILTLTGTRKQKLVIEDNHEK